MLGGCDVLAFTAVRRKDLDRYLTIERRLAAKVDGAHAAAPEETHHGVARSEGGFERIAPRRRLSWAYGGGTLGTEPSARRHLAAA